MSCALGGCAQPTIVFQGWGVPAEVTRTALYMASRLAVDSTAIYWSGTDGVARLVK